MEGDSIASEHGDCSGVVENENDWGLGDAVLEDLAVESHAASARGGAGASHASHGSHYAARVPSVWWSWEHIFLLCCCHRKLLQ